jgi:hypothetical protein
MMGLRESQIVFMESGRGGQKPESRALRAACEGLTSGALPRLAHQKRTGKKQFWMGLLCLWRASILQEDATPVQLG